MDNWLFLPIGIFCLSLVSLDFTECPLHHYEHAAAKHYRGAIFTHRYGAFCSLFISHSEHAHLGSRVRYLCSIVGMQLEPDPYQMSFNCSLRYTQLLGYLLIRPSLCHEPNN